jgi:hypothetical protein
MVRKVALTCVSCGSKQSFRASSPAAPVLTACEAAHANAGWSYEIGFFSMLTGDHRPRCAACTAAAKGKEKENG